ncbi:MAG TPA: hypothetical protein VL197_15580 [Nitrospirota bacterium]|nr:hypothetical protein [Nitrospirota bacterium]
MKRFLIKAGALTLLVLATVSTVFLLPIPYSDNLSAIVNKRDLLKDGRRDRIVFVGGSGLFDGLDSGLVEQRLRRPVVNMGLYAGFAITPLLREIRPFLRSGDTVVIVPEYSVVFDALDFQARKWVFALAPARNLRLYREGQNRTLAFLTDMTGLLRSKLQALPKAVREAVRTRRLAPLVGEGYAYYGKYFNLYGDSLRTMRAAVPGVIEQTGVDLFADAAYRDQSFASVNAFCREVRGMGVQALFFFPAYPEEEYRRQEEAMKLYEARLRKELDCRILGTPQDFLYPYEYFTNTVNHINNEARRIRTERVLAYLERAVMPQGFGERRVKNENKVVKQYP